ncbi:MAG: hypothetical protein V2J42_12745 [Wenzhouxiangella sp.]|nr:hypothetical protein [Wenzhouxiangella sp.]
MKSLLNPLKTAVWMATLVMMLSGCGSGAREIRGELPLVRFEGLIVDDEKLTLSVGLRNVNDRTLNLRRLKVRLTVEDQLLIETEARPQIDITARGRELITLRGSGEAAGLQVLARRFDQPRGDGLTGAAPNAPWVMELTLVDDRERESTTRANGFLHPVPGRPGHFR